MMLRLVLVSCKKAVFAGWIFISTPLHPLHGTRERPSTFSIFRLSPVKTFVGRDATLVNERKVLHHPCSTLDTFCCCRQQKKRSRMVHLCRGKYISRCVDGLRTIITFLCRFMGRHHNRNAQQSLPRRTTVRVNGRKLVALPKTQRKSRKVRSTISRTSS